MGAQVRYGTIAVGAYCANAPGSHQVAFTDQYKPRWDRGGSRGPYNRKDLRNWASQWSFGARVGFGTPGGSDGASPRDLSYPDLYEPFSCNTDGTSLTRFLVGTTVDASDVAVANATVQVFRTSDDFYLGQDVSRLDGRYIAPADVPAGTQLYVVAYKAGSPDTGGTSVNTLTNTLADGT